ncbi:MAG: aminotransferase class IV [Polyangiaceae bacterium]|nr:aminotransferase class IV [Polyangiaceae bacterium]
MSQVVMINGQLVPPKEASVSVFDRGFLYGDSVFETLRTYNGVPFRMDLHMERLAWSAERVLIPLPVTLESLALEIEAAVRAADNPDSYVRVVVTRGTADTLGLDPALSIHPTRVVLVGPLHPPHQEAYQNGVSVITYRTARVSDQTVASGAKVGNYLVAVLAMHEAKQKGAVEALILDGVGRVLEGATSNVFAVRSGTLATPPLDLGILPGITRRVVMELAVQLGLVVHEQPIGLAELLDADEVFISSSIREVLPVVAVDERKIAQGTPGHITQRLMAAFHELTRNQGSHER